jgi:hypothetical protein
MTTINEDMDAAVALESMMTDVAGASYEKVPSKAEVQAAQLAAIKETDIDVLLELQEQMTNIIDIIVGNTIDLDNLGELSEEQLEVHMEEYLNQKPVKQLLELRERMIRAALFAHFTEKNRQNKVAFPDHAPGEVDVPRFGKRFTREGGKLKSRFDRDKMAQVLTPAQFASVYKTVHVEEQVIEAHDEEIFDRDALKALIGSNFAILEVLKAAVVPEGFTPSSFHVRAMQKKSKTEG